MAITQVQVTISSTSKEGNYAGRVFKGWETYSINVKGEQITKKRLWTFWLETAAERAGGPRKTRCFAGRNRNKPAESSPSQACK